MQNYFLSVGLMLAIITGLAILISVLFRKRIGWGWFVGGCLVVAGYAATSALGRQVLPLEDLLGVDLNWNWAGKIVSIACALVLLTILSLFRRSAFQDAGVTLRQEPGSLIPALMACAIFIALQVGSEIAANDGQSLGVERLLFQATMPGLDEELVLRGVALLMLNEAFGRNWNVLGARMGWGGMLLTVLFGLMHGLSIADGAVALNWGAIAITGALGFGLLWVRERTGSILIPILLHNAINVSGSFF